jgi:hypothetical protein
MINVGFNKNGSVVVNDVEIDSSIFDEEKINYKLTKREEMVDDLIGFIAEVRYNPDMKSELISMKNDLRYLNCEINDEYIFLNVETSEYIAESDEPEMFYEICKELLILSGLSEKEAENELKETK